MAAIESRAQGGEKEFKKVKVDEVIKYKKRKCKMLWQLLRAEPREGRRSLKKGKVDELIICKK